MNCNANANFSIPNKPSYITFRKNYSLVLSDVLVHTYLIWIMWVLHVKKVMRHKKVANKRHAEVSYSSILLYNCNVVSYSKVNYWILILIGRLGLLGELKLVNTYSFKTWLIHGFFLSAYIKTKTLYTDSGQITWREGNLAIAQKTFLRHNSLRVMTFNVGPYLWMKSKSQF